MSSKKNIKIVTYGNFPFGGASANFIRYFALSLSLIDDNEVEVLIPSGYYYGKTKQKERRGSLKKVKYSYLGFKNHPKNYLGKLIDNIIAPFLLFIYLLKQLVFNSIDVVIIYNPFLINSIPLLIIKALFRTKITIILPEYYDKPKSFFSKLKWYSFYLSINHLIKFYNGIIVLSSYLQEFVALKTKVKTMVLPNIMDPNKFDIQDVVEFKKNRITIGYVGTPTRKDGVEDLIRSFTLLHKKHINTHLLIIGDITNGDTLIPTLKTLASEYDVLEDITFTGLVPHDRVPKLLNSCQILALTRPNGRFAEAGFPTKIGEYFACRKPVVVTRVGDIPKYFENEKHVILVEPENIDDIAWGFEKLILNPDLKDYIAENAFTWMNNQLNYKNISFKINDFIERVVNG